VNKKKVIPLDKYVKNSLETEIDDVVTFNGIYFSFFSKTERIHYLEQLMNYAEKLHYKSLWWAILNLKEAYFFYMTEKEKEKYINLILKLNIGKSFYLWVDLFEFIGNVLKIATLEQKEKLTKYLLLKLNDNKNLPEVIVSFCHVAEFIYFEVNDDSRNKLLEKLGGIMMNNPYGYLQQTLNYTYDKIKKFEKQYESCTYST
jgi:hypothetical protein